MWNIKKPNRRQHYLERWQIISWLSSAKVIKQFVFLLEKCETIFFYSKTIPSFYEKNMSNSAVCFLFHLPFFFLSSFLCSRSFRRLMSLFRFVRRNICVSVFLFCSQRQNRETLKERRKKKAHDYVASKECWTVGGI